MSKKENKYENYNQFHLLSTLRKNAIMWYPFKNNSKILHIGSEAGILTEFLCTKGEVFCINENIDLNTINQIRNPRAHIYNYSIPKFISDFNQKVDYVVIEGLLDTISNKKDVLTKCQNILNEDGQIIVLTNNKLGIQYFSGAKDNIISNDFDNILSKNNLYTKKQWCELLDNLKLKYQFYYPYPNYEFSEYIFSNTPNVSDINRSLSIFEGYRNEYFDEVKAMRHIIEMGSFEDFTNSYMIIINASCPIKYTKFARERKKIYQIYTSIVNRNDDKYVVKIPIYDIGKEHMNHIYETYERFKSINKYNNIAYCPVIKDNNNLIFNFIKGKTLEELINEDVEKNNVYEIEKKLDIVDKIISIGECTPFKVNESFLEIFTNQDYSILNNKECYEITNIDLILDNILVNDCYNVIDYEWILDCQVPKSFIMFRTIFHSHALSKLPKDILDRIYQRYGISKDLGRIYLNMEVHFQEYVSNFKLENIYKDLQCVKLPIRNEKNRVKIFRCIQKSIEQKQIVVDSLNYDLTFNINKEQNLKIELGEMAILKIEKIKLGDTAVSDFTTNAVLINGNDYYFDSKPIIEIQNNGNELVKIEGICYYYGETEVSDILRLTLDNDNLLKKCKELNRCNENLNNHIEKLRKHFVVKLIDKIGD